MIVHPQAQLTIFAMGVNLGYVLYNRAGLRLAPLFLRDEKEGAHLGDKLDFLSSQVKERVAACGIRE